VIYLELEGYRLKDAIERSLKKIIESGAQSALMVNPEGFVFMDIGDVDERDKAIATFFVAIFPKMQAYVNSASSRIFSELIKTQVMLKDFILGQMHFRVEDRDYVGMYVEGYSIVARVYSSEYLDRVRVTLIRAVASIISLLRKFKAHFAISPLTEAEPIVHERAPLRRVSEVKAKIDFSDIDVAYQYIRKLTLDAIKVINEDKRWNAILNSFIELRNSLSLLSEKHPKLREDSVFSAIMRWLDNTVTKIQRMISLGREKVSDDEKREVLRRGLMQLLAHLKRVLSKLGGR